MTLDDQWAGRKGKCKTCGTVVVVPRLAAAKQSNPAVPMAGREPDRLPQKPIPDPPAEESIAATSAEKPAPERMQQAIAAAFDGQIAKIRTPLTYRFGILLVSVVMVLLPLLYLALIALVAYGVYYHLGHHTGMLEAGRGRGAVLVFLAYLAPLIVGVILVVFMIKPLFARPAKRPRTRSLSRDAEPLLFEFVDRVCHAVRAPRPRRIDVDCDVNASASFRNGIWSMIVGKDLVLTIGMPLVAGLEARQLGGVLGHEFGHFSQGAGMRLTYIIRSISHWFTRVVYERDQWDQWLADAAESVDLRFGWVLYLARLCVWVTRRILWLLMIVGHAISGYMLRQMEFDADMHEIRLAGSATFESTSRRLRELGLANQKAHSDLSNFYREGRLGDDVPRLTRFNADQIDEELAAKLQAASEEAKTGAFDTHPPDRLRIAAAQREQAPGILTIDCPASDLFVHYEETCRNVTWDFYCTVFGSQFKATDMHPTDDLLRRQQQERATFEALDRYFLGQFNPYRPVPLGDACATQPSDPKAVLQSLRDQRTTLAETHPEYAKALEAYNQAESRHLQAVVAKALFAAELRVREEQFEIPVKSRSDARELMEQADTAMSRIGNRMAPFEQMMGQRLADGLRLLHVPKVMERIEDAASRQEEARRLLPILEAIRPLMDHVMRLRNEGVTLGLLLQYLDGNESNQPLISGILATAGRIRSELSDLQTRTADVDYPFDHAEGTIALAQYLIPGIPSEEQVGQTAGIAEQVVEALTDLNVRILAHLTQTAETVERAIGLKPLEAPAATTTD
jgi:Zn-dependent protease with chaperone function